MRAAFYTLIKSENKTKKEGTDFLMFPMEKSKFSSL